MNIKYLIFNIAVVLCWSTNSHANKVVNDDFMTNGTATTDASYFGSSGSNALEVNMNSVGLVSGTSGRQMHALFETQTLANPGDMLKASITFMTPTTIGTLGESLRLGLFDHLERNTPDQLGQNTSYNSTTPNASFSGLPGFYLELDVESADPATDLDLRRSNPSTTGLLLSNSTGFTAFGSGPDIGYVFAPDTAYTIVFTLVRTSDDALNITADFLDQSQTVVDTTPASFNFGMLALGASGGAFGSSSAAGAADNGIDILTSGRHVHALFETQTLEKVGDILRARIDFTTPDTISIGGDDLRIGLFDHLDRNTPDRLGQNTTFTSSNPNLDFSGLPGYSLEIDVDTTDPKSDLDIRKSIPTTTGRLLNTTSGFDKLGDSADLGYAIESNTQCKLSGPIIYGLRCGTTFI